MNKKMNTVTLNIPYDMPDDKWNIIDQIYKTMPGWQGYIDGGCPAWNIKNGETISASVEPSGLVVEGSSPDSDIAEWVSLFIKTASDKLGFVVKDAEE